MKLLWIVLAVLAAVLTVLPLVSFGGGLAGTDQVLLAGYESGWEQTQLPQTYTFGLTDKKDGTCSTYEVTEGNFADALKEAQDLCPGCYVENITGRVKTGQAYWNEVPLSEEYCEPKQ